MSSDLCTLTVVRQELLLSDATLSIPVVFIAGVTVGVLINSAYRRLMISKIKAQFLQELDCYKRNEDWRLER
jgi:hypothetical protein